MEIVKLIIPKKSEYISSLRLMTSSLSNIKGFNVDEIEDLKVIISEICTFFMKNIENSENGFEIEYHMDGNNFKIQAVDTNVGEIPEIVKEDSEMCILIIESLSDKYILDLDNKKICIEKKLHKF